MGSTKKMREAFDPQLGLLVRDAETSSARIRAKLGNQFDWCFCELCWRQTEYWGILEAPTVVKRLEKKNARELPLTASMRAKAEQRTNEMVERYRLACQGKLGPYEAAAMLRRYCHIPDLDGDLSPESFNDHVHMRMLYTEWARHGEVMRQTRLPHHLSDGSKPSRLYCEFHNPRRSEEARRAYQRDRRFKIEFQELIDLARRDAINSGKLMGWNVGTITKLRRSAFRQLQVLKAPKAPATTIDDLLAQGMSQAEIARQLDVSRQAISAAIKRRNRKVAMR